MFCIATKNYHFCFNFFDKSFPHFEQEFQNKEKLQYISEYLKVRKLFTLRQTHSTKIVDLEGIEQKQSTIEYDGDGIICSEINTAVGIKTADCVPVLLFCESHHLIAGIHCGWKGTHNNIIKNLIHKIRLRGVEKISAIIGPSIQKKSYVVQRDLVKKITESDKSYIKFFEKSENTIKFDLQALIKEKLNLEQVKIYYVSKEDTFSNPQKYPSYRYTLHTKQDNKLHKMLSVIAINKKNEKINPI